ncbi:MAG TPA: DsbC family protein [Geobacteraceae bacterium]
MGKSLLYGLLMLLWTASGAFGMDGCGAGPCANCHSLTLKEANELLRGVGEVKKVQPAPVKGLWLLELQKDGRQGVVFMDYGKKNLVAGTVFPILPKIDARVPAGADAGVPRISVASISVENSIVLGNPQGKKRLFVFTDPDCPFCARMHAELKRLVAMDPEVAVFVKLFPLSMHPGAYDKAWAILDGNSRELLDKAFAGASLPKPGADKGKRAVDETIRVARQIGVDSTPTLVLADGRMIAGFRDAAALGRLLGGSDR